MAEGPRRASAERPLATYFTDADYPPGALRQGVEGTVEIEVDFGTTGRPTRCLVTGTSGNPELDGRTCQILLERVRFKTAIDDAGRPMPDTIRQRVIWRVEDSPYYLFARQQGVSVMTAGPDGPMCRQQINDEPMTRISARECMDLFGPEFAEQASNGFEIRLVHTFLPAGSAPFAAVPESYGTRMTQTVVELSVDADGRVPTCRVVQAEPVESGHDPCEWYRSIAYDPSPDGQAIRRARATGAYYVRQRPAS